MPPYLIDVSIANMIPPKKAGHDIDEYVQAFLAETISVGHGFQPVQQYDRFRGVDLVRQTGNAGHAYYP